MTEAATAPAPRRRSRRTATPGAAAVQNDTTDGRLERLYAAKVAADEAKAAYDAQKAEFKTHLETQGKESHTLAAAGDRPAVTAKLATRETTTVDPAKFKAVVDEGEFMACVKVGLTDAKKYLGTSQIAKVSDTATSAPFLDVRVRGANRK